MMITAKVQQIEAIASGKAPKRASLDHGPEFAAELVNEQVFAALK